MEQICGFLDSVGRFHKTEIECEISELTIKIERLEEQLYRFSSRLRDCVIHKEPYENRTYYNSVDIITKKISKLIIKDMDYYMGILNEIKDLEIQIDKLKQKLPDQRKSWLTSLMWWKN